MKSFFILREGRFSFFFMQAIKLKTSLLQIHGQIFAIVIFSIKICVLKVRFFNRADKKIYKSGDYFADGYHASNGCRSEVMVG